MLYDGLPGELPTIRPTAGCKDIYLLGSRVSKQLFNKVAIPPAAVPIKKFPAANPSILSH